MDNPDWAPSLKLGYSSCHSASHSMERYERIATRNSRKRSRVDDDGTDGADDEVDGSDVVDDGDGDTAACMVDNEVEGDKEMSGDDDDDESDDLGKAVQTDLTSTYISKLEENIVLMDNKNRYIAAEAEKAREEMVTESKEQESFLKKEIARLKKEVDDLVYNEASFKDNDEKVLFYTGLSTWELFHVLFQYVKPQLKQHSILTPFQQLMITLMRLRLGLSGQDLAYRFRVSSAIISRTFTHVIDVVYHQLKPLIIWPDRDALKKTMPMEFRKHFPNCVVIIDCFEIFLDRPTNLLARAQTFSQYKHHNTVKYLIGVTPQGTVSFISEGWGGRTSDKYLTEQCSFLTHLVPGDLVLADRGFDISDSVGAYCSTLKMPAFTKGKKQLSSIEVEQTRKIANVRIHVERVIGNIRQKYSILSCTQPIDFVNSNDQVTTLDKIVCVTCALVNMCDSVVPFD